MTTLKDIRERWEKATPGPWLGSVNGWVRPIIGTETEYTHRYGDDMYAWTPEDAIAIANAPTDIAYLLGLVERAKDLLPAIIQYETLGSEGIKEARQLLADMESVKGAE